MKVINLAVIRVILVYFEALADRLSLPHTDLQKREKIEWQLAYQKVNTINTHQSQNILLIDSTVYAKAIK